MDPKTQKGNQFLRKTYHMTYVVPLVDRNRHIHLAYDDLTSHLNVAAGARLSRVKQQRVAPQPLKWREQAVEPRTSLVSWMKHVPS